MFLFTSISCSLLLGEIPCNQPSEVPPGFFFPPFSQCLFLPLAKAGRDSLLPPLPVTELTWDPHPESCNQGWGLLPWLCMWLRCCLSLNGGDDMRMDGAALPTFLCPLLCLLWGCVPPALIGCGQGVFLTPSWGLQLHLSHVLGGGGRQCQAGRERERERERGLFCI